MPLVHINIIEGRPADMKERLIREVTKAVSNSLEAPPENVRVLIQEIPATHWAVGGKSMDEIRSKQ